jgi:hypothetical protein
VRLANYLNTLRRDLLKVSEAVGVWHPGLVDGDDIELVTEATYSTTLREAYRYEPGWGQVGPQVREEIETIMRRLAEPEEKDPESAPRD